MKFQRHLGHVTLQCANTDAHHTHTHVERQTLKWRCYALPRIIHILIWTISEIPIYFYETKRLQKVSMEDFRKKQ